MQMAGCGAALVAADAKIIRLPFAGLGLGRSLAARKTAIEKQGLL